MSSQSLNVLGLEISFKENADPERIERTRVLLEDRFEQLRQQGVHISKERLLTFLAISLADDYIMMKDASKNTQERLEKLLASIESKVD